jgi:phage protein D
MTTPPREVIIDLKYNNVDITMDVAPFLESIRYVDRTLPNKMDELSVTFQDVEALWRNGWLPNRGATLSAVIKAFNWFQYGQSFERNCGSFEIDDITCSSNPSNICQLSAISVGITNSIRRQQNTKAWEETEVKQIAQDIADKHGFELLWFSKHNPMLERWEQKGQSDLSVLIDICEYAGLMIKITDKHIIIFRGEEYDKKEPEVIIWRDDDTVKSWEFNMNSVDIYAAAEVKYYDPKEKKLIEYIFYSDDVKGAKKDKEKGDIPDPEVGQILKINQRVLNIGEAEEVAKAALRSKNMRQVRGSLTCMGRPDLYSGMTLLINGFGRWDSVIWNLEEISHDYSKSGGYNSTLTLRGILGY